MASRSGNTGKFGRGGSRRRRIVGASSAVGAFLAFGMTPLAGAPAQADFDFFDPFSWFDLDSAADTAGVADATSFAWTFDDWAGLSSGDPSAWVAFDDQLYQAIYDPMEAMISNPANGWWLDPLNQAFATGDSCGVLCNGVDAHINDDGDLIQAQDGGAWFGDGGDGIDGSDGGAAGMFGNGGTGGDAAAGSTVTIDDAVYAGSGGDGGAGGTLMGYGGNGGNGGDAFVDGDGNVVLAGTGGNGGDGMGQVGIGNGGDGGVGGAGLDATAGHAATAGGLGGNGGSAGPHTGNGGNGGAGGVGGQGMQGETGSFATGDGNGGSGSAGAAGGNGGVGGNGGAVY